MSNIVWMTSRTDWFVMNMIKKYLKELKKMPPSAETIEAIERNEVALRSFFDDIKGRSTPKAA